jgi:hypothetical protein
VEPPNSISTSSRLTLVLVAAAVVAVSLATFFPVLEHGFVPLDDEQTLLRNPDYRGLGLEQLAWMFTTRRLGHYQPLAWVSFGLDYLLWGMDPRGYHATSLLFHVVNGLLVGALALVLYRRSPALTRPAALTAGATVAALLFAVHPLRVESVAWATERRDVLCGFFCLLCLLAETTELVPSARRRTVSLLLFTAALLSKGLAVALPVALIAVDRLGMGVEEPRSWRETLRVRMPFFALSLASVVTTLWASAPARAAVNVIGIPARLAAMSWSLWFYLRATLVPVALPFYAAWPRTPPVRLATPIYAAAAVALVVAAVTLFALRRRWPALIAAAAVYVAFVLPVSGLLQAGPQFVALRYSYLSCVPWALLAGFGVARVLTRASPWRSALLGVALAGVVGALAIATRAQLALWDNALSFCRAAVASAPDAWQPRYLLAREYLQHERWGEAVGELEIGLHRPPLERPLVAMGALLRATCPDSRFRNGPAALTLARRAARASGYDDASALYALSAAQAETSDFGAAIASASRALGPLPKPAGRLLTVELERALRGYRAGRALRLRGSNWL